MSKREDYESRTEELLAPIAEANQVEIYDVEYVKEGSDYYLRAYIDKPEGVNILDCENVSRALSEALDKADFIPDAYILEVSSPGLGRTLKKDKHLQKSIGEEVEIKSIAREAGSRTKIAVWSNNPNVDAVGACVGMNGARVNAIVEELRGEKIDIVNWDENPGNLIQNALSPAKIVAVFADPDEKTAKVVVPDYQLSLAIGKEGQNARLAARLTGYKIDIKSETQAKDAPGFRYEDYVDDYEDETEDDFDGEQE